MMPLILVVFPLKFALSAPSAEEILHRSRAAYDAVDSFEQEVMGTMIGRSWTSRISFSRPINVRISGTSVSGSTFDLISDGRVNWLRDRGDWTLIKSDEMGSKMIGETLGAASIVIGALTRDPLENVLLPAHPLSVAQTSFQGRSAYLVSSTNIGHVDIWFDATTYYIVHVELRVMKLKTSLDFSAPKVNQEISASRFKH